MAATRRRSLTLSFPSSWCRRLWLPSFRGLISMLLLVIIVVVGAQQQHHDNNLPLLFSFAGQSNMIGHTTGSGSSDPTQFQKIVEVMTTNDTSNETERYQQLKSMFDEADEARSETTEFLARYILELDDRDLMDNLNTPLTYATCSFVDPGYTPSSHFPPPVVVQVSTGSKGCGRNFGHEYMFAKSLFRSSSSSTTTGVSTSPWMDATIKHFHIAKVAKGGTEIYEDWNVGNGRMWMALNHSIHSMTTTALGGTWRAFVWHQGENDCFVGSDGIDTSLTYEGNLTALIRQVRIEMHRATPYYATAADIPVIIVGIHWPRGRGPGDLRARYQQIVGAQRRLARTDPRAEFVSTDNLKGNYHLNAGQLLVVGDRIAQQLEPLLKGGRPPPSTLPMPTMQPTPQPARPPTPQEPIFVNCGGREVNDGIHTWLADTNYVETGSIYPQSLQGRPNITTNLFVQEIYMTERYGEEMIYTFPLQDGTYDVNLHLAEIFPFAFRPGARIFSVLVQGKIRLDSIDVFALAGAGNTAYIEEVPGVEVRNGTLTIEFIKVRQVPKINAISILPTVETTTTTVLPETASTMTQDPTVPEATTTTEDPTMTETTTSEAGTSTTNTTPEVASTTTTTGQNSTPTTSTTATTPEPIDRTTTTTTSTLTTQSSMAATTTTTMQNQTATSSTTTLPDETTTTSTMASSSTQDQSTTTTTTSSTTSTATTEAPLVTTTSSSSTATTSTSTMLSTMASTLSLFVVCVEPGIIKI